MDIEDLQNFKVRFVKIDAKKLLTHSSEKAFTEIHKRKRRLEANGIGVIIEKIETEDAMRKLLDFDIHTDRDIYSASPSLRVRIKNASERDARMGIPV